MPYDNTCRICGGLARFAFEREGWRYARCKECSALIKLLTPEAYADLNPSYDPGPDVAIASPTLVRSYLDVDGKVKLLRELLPDVTGARRFLDIGCGAGGYLFAARELGLEAVGVEPSAAHSTIAKSLGLNVVDGYFSAELFEKDPFDIVLLSHVIEHIYDPLPFLEECLRVLRPGGVLCVVTPNADSLLARLSGSYWVMLKPLDHVSMFAAGSFRTPAVAALGLYKLKQSEFVWEPLISLAAAGRDGLKPMARRLRTKTHSTAGDAPRVSRQSSVAWSQNLAFVRHLATGVGLPLHLAARATAREATLVARFRRS